ncbi:uncharacterized protein METZ01_LOCUS432475, partial [marine metagenome]
MVSATSALFAIDALESSDGTIGLLSIIGVSTSPGIIAVAFIIVFFNSALRYSVKLITPALAAPYDNPAIRLPDNPATDDTFTIRPLFTFFILGNTACVNKTVPS